MDSADVVDLDFALIHQNISIKTTDFLERLKYRESSSTFLPFYTFCEF